MALHTLNCDFCKEKFIAKKKEINRGRRFCSRECGWKSRDNGLLNTKSTKKFYPSPVSIQYSHLRTRASKKGVPFCEKDDFLRWFFTTQKICDYCGIPEETLVNIYGDKGSKYCLRLEIDKKIPSKGYVVGNMVFSCRFCNVVKSDVLDYQEMKEIAEKYMVKKWKNKLIFNQEKVVV